MIFHVLFGILVLLIAVIVFYVMNILQDFICKGFDKKHLWDADKYLCETKDIKTIIEDPNEKLLSYLMDMIKENPPYNPILSYRDPEAIDNNYPELQIWVNTKTGCVFVLIDCINVFWSRLNQRYPDRLKDCNET